MGPVAQAMTMPSDTGRAARLTALLAKPDYADLVKPGVAAVLWSADGVALWSSEVGGGLANALAPSARAQVATLAGGLAPLEGLRLERLRFAAGLRSELITCACRRVALAAGGHGLVAVAAGPLPARLRTTRIAEPAAEVVWNAAAAPGGATVDPLEALKALAGKRPTIRFVWETDVAGVFSRVSPDLVAVVGEAPARIVGRTFADLGAVVVDRSRGVMAAMADHKTWGGLSVLWRVADTAAAVPVELAAVPVHDRERRFAGFRGYGLCRLSGLVPDAFSAPSAVIAAPQDAAAPSKVVTAAKPAEELTAAAADAKVATPAHERPADVHGAPDVHEAPSVTAPTAEPEASPLTALSMNERNAFREIAKALGARFAGDDGEEPTSPSVEPVRLVPKAPANDRTVSASLLLDRLPIGILVNRGERALYANRAFLDLARFDDLPGLQEEGLSRVFGGRAGDGWAGRGEAPVFLMTPRGDRVAVEAQLTSLDWDGAAATLMIFRRFVEPAASQRVKTLEFELKAHESREGELTSILDTATDGVIVLDDKGRMLSLNRSAEALFGYDQNEVAGEMFTLLLARESHAIAFDYLEGLKSSGVASVLNDGREVVGRVRQGGRCPLFMTIGRVGEGRERKFCLVLRDMTAWKKAESELLDAKRAAERASSQKSDFLAKISHEIRTPLNAIIGFAEVMLEERFGPVGNERYREYLRDIHASGGHVISLVNDLLDLAKIEAGRLELSFTSVNLNDVVSSCVALMQPQASRGRIVLRNSLAPKLPPVVADERSMRQVVLNILSNAIKFTDAGGQVIVSTTLTERGEVTLRVRDTGIGMTDKEVETALEPFRQLATARVSGGTGLGLPLTKALVEANRGALNISSVKNEGTLVEIVMPRTRVLAE
jgi:PAS domain S-box-containing protein